MKDEISDWFRLTTTTSESTRPLHILLRLLAGLLTGLIISWVYRKTRFAGSKMPETFPITLVMLAVLICAVIQLIGDSVARAFSVVGTLSIVRYRTVVQDTRDTAFVVFAVVEGMAIGSDHLWVAVISLILVSIIAAVMQVRSANESGGNLTAIGDEYRLTMKFLPGVDGPMHVEPILDEVANQFELVSVATLRQGAGVETVYKLQVAVGADVNAMVKEINGLPGVVSLEVRRA